MNTTAIIEMQTRIGTTPDGFWGPKSIAACQAHLRALMPTPNPWPATDQASLSAFYGYPGDESRHVKMDVDGLGVKYDGNPVTFIRCHERVSASLYSIFAAIAKSRHAGILAHYDGCYANRPMRGGSTPSLHARAAAVDLDSALNGNTAHWPAQAMMPLAVMEIFAAEGWLSAGAFWSRDSMHFQGTR